MPGNLYLQQDIREQTLSDKIGLLDNKLYLNLRYKFLDEGISFDNEENIKLAGLYDPEENGLTMDLWINSDGEEIQSVLNKINKINLSNDAKE